MDLTLFYVKHSCIWTFFPRNTDMQHRPADSLGYIYVNTVYECLLMFQKINALTQYCIIWLELIAKASRKWQIQCLHSFPKFYDFYFIITKHLFRYLTCINVTLPMKKESLIINKFHGKTFFYQPFMGPWKSIPISQ